MRRLYTVFSGFIDVFCVQLHNDVDNTVRGLLVDNYLTIHFFHLSDFLR